MTPQDPIFKQIIDKKVKANVLYEDNDIIAILDLFPATTGHTLVIPKCPSINLFDMDEVTLQMMISKTRWIALQLVNKLQVDGFKLLINNNESAGQRVFYSHFHIIPSDNSPFKAYKDDFAKLATMLTIDKNK